MGGAIRGGLRGRVLDPPLRSSRDGVTKAVATTIRALIAAAGITNGLKRNGCGCVWKWQWAGVVCLA